MAQQQQQKSFLGTIRLDTQLRKYAEILEGEEVTTWAVAAELTDSELKDVGLKLGARKHFAAVIAAYKGTSDDAKQPPKPKDSSAPAVPTTVTSSSVVEVKVPAANVRAGNAALKEDLKKTEADAAGFINALRAEYVHGKENGVGDWLDSSVDTGDLDIENFEGRVRNATDTATEIDAIRKELGVDAAVAPSEGTSDDAKQSPKPKDASAAAVPTTVTSSSVSAAAKASAQRKRMITPAHGAFQNKVGVISNRTVSGNLINKDVFTIESWMLYPKMITPWGSTVYQMTTENGRNWKLIRAYCNHQYEDYNKCDIVKTEKYEFQLLCDGVSVQKWKGEREAGKEGWGTQEVQLVAPDSIKISKKIPQKLNLMWPSMDTTATILVKASEVRQSVDCTIMDEDRFQMLWEQCKTRPFVPGGTAHGPGTIELFHATTQEAQEAILKSGFRLATPQEAINKGLKLGAAVYFGTNATYCMSEAKNSVEDKWESGKFKNRTEYKAALKGLSVIRIVAKLGCCIDLGDYDRGNRTKLGNSDFDWMTERLSAEKGKVLGFDSISINRGQYDFEVALYDPKTQILDQSKY